MTTPVLIVVVMLAGAALGAMGRAVLRRRVHLSWSSTVLVGMAGGAIGSGIVGAFGARPLLSLAVSLVTTVGDLPR